MSLSYAKAAQLKQAKQPSTTSERRNWKGKFCGSNPQTRNTHPDSHYGRIRPPSREVGSCHTKR